MSIDASRGRPLLPGRRRAEDFARALEGSLPADPAVAPLVVLAQQLQALPLGPTDDFRDRLRTRLLAVAAVAPAEPAPSTRPTSALSGVLAGWRGQRRFAVAAGSLAAVVAVAGVGVAGGRSLPGDPFYGVKRGGEALELATTHGLLARGRLHLRFARERLREVDQLSGAPQALAPAPGLAGLAPVAGQPAFGGSLDQRVVDTLRRMDADTVAGSDDLTAVYRRSHDTTPLVEVARFASTQSAALGALATRLPAATQGAAATSLAILQRLSASTGTLLSGGLCTDACRPTPQPTPSAGPAAVPPAASVPAAPRRCGCPTPPAAPAPTPVAPTEPSAEPSPTDSAAPDQPAPSSPAQPSRPGRSPSPSPSPSPSSAVDQVQQIVHKLPLPVPVPTITPPLPLPSAVRPTGISLP